jgi:hypothetical protein
MDHLQRMAIVEEARANIAAAKQAIEERQAHVAAASESRRAPGPPREIKQRSAAIPGVVYKTRADALVRPKRGRVSQKETLTTIEGRNSWASSFAELMGEEVARAQNKVTAKLRKEIDALRGEIAVLRGMIEGGVKMLPAPKDRSDAA